MIGRRRRRGSGRSRGSTGGDFPLGERSPPPLDQNADGATDADDAQNQFGEDEDAAGVPQRRSYRCGAVIRRGRREAAAAAAKFFRRKEVDERRGRGGHQQGQRQGPFDVVENTEDAEEYVKEADPNGEQESAADEDRLEHVEKHEAGAADDVRRPHDAEKPRLGRLFRRRGRRRRRRSGEAGRV